MSTAVTSHAEARRPAVRRAAAMLALCALATPASAWAQENPLSMHNRWMYSGVKTLLLRSAEKMPEQNYGFRPTEGVRTFGQIIGHATDAQYTYCSIVLGEKNPALQIEKTRTSKAELVAALQEAFAYCDRAYDAMTDAAATEPLAMHGGQMPKLGLLAVNNLHSTEHYGNLVTYLRLNNIVPPSSEPGFAVPPPKK